MPLLTPKIATTNDTDIARIANVSITTVSRVINNGKVGKQLKKKVAGIICKYEYSTVPYAQYLGRRRNHTNSLPKTESVSKKV